MQTDVEEWRRVASGEQQGWEPRAQFIAKFIRSSDIVLDIGAGDQKLKRFIPASCQYIPVDCVDIMPGTFIVDFNREFRLPDLPYTIIVCAGFLEYLNDLKDFFEHLSRHANRKQIIFTYFLDPVKNTRSEMKAHNSFKNVDDLIEVIGFAFSHIEILGYLNNTVIVSASLTDNVRTLLPGAPTINQLLVEPPQVDGFHKFLARIGRSIRKRLPRAAPGA